MNPNWISFNTISGTWISLLITLTRGVCWLTSMSGHNPECILKFYRMKWCHLLSNMIDGKIAHTLHNTLCFIWNVYYKVKTAIGNKIARHCLFDWVVFVLHNNILGNFILIKKKYYHNKKTTLVFCWRRTMIYSLQSD